MQTVSASEVERITHHIHRAEQLASARDVSALTHVQRLVRQLLLRLLADYRAAGRFPINRDFAANTPYFIDGDGTRCAMAHLLELGGEQDLVARIARERNNAYVRELADEPRLLEWLAAAGLTVEEAAAIQPSYCSPLADCFCGGSFSQPNYPLPATGVLEGVVTVSGMVRVDAVYGDVQGIAIGSVVAVDLGFPPGTPMLVPVDAAAAEPYGAILVESDGVHCNSQGTGETPTVSTSDLITAVQASDCHAAMADADAVWATNSCDGEGGDGPFDDGGCNAGGGEAMSIGILLALVGVLVRRR